MEYLTIAGGLCLTENLDEKRLALILQQLESIEFDRQGSVIVERQEALLLISAEGEISETVGIDTILLLQALNAFTTAASLIVVSRVRWELNITLSYRENSASALKPHLPDFLNGQDAHRLMIL